MSMIDYCIEKNIFFLFFNIRVVYHFTHTTKDMCGITINITFGMSLIDNPIEKYQKSISSI